MSKSPYNNKSILAISLALGFSCAIPLWSAPAIAEGNNTAGFSLPSADSQLLFDADNVTYDQSNNAVIASGDVELAYGDRIVTADEVTYYQSQNLVAAKGNVTLIEPSGDVIFADYTELTGDLAQGFIDNFRALLSDDSRLAGQTGERTEGNISRLNYAVFSPCDVCEEDPNKAPFWRIRARRVIHDQSSHEIIYHHARLEMFGIPVAYSPYFAHPDPTVEQKSGFLAPSAGTTNPLGAYARAYYYYGPNMQRDFTFETLLSEKKGGLVGAEWRERLENGQFQLAGSVAYSDREVGPVSSPTTISDRWRGHIFGNGEYNFNENWRAGFELARVSDRDYLSTYRYEAPGILENSLYTEGFYDRNYISAELFDFQDIRRGTRPQEPMVLPNLNFQAFGDPATTFGGRWEVNGQAIAIHRDGAGLQDSRRITGEAAWQRNLQHRSGLIADVTIETALDLFSGENIGGTIDNNLEVRILPQAAIELNFPVVGDIGEWQHLITPTMQFIAAPNLNAEADLPNEDSTDLEFDAGNIFSLNRFPGNDLRESGVRVNYGLGTEFHGPDGEIISGFIGQSYRITSNDDNVPAFSGLTGHSSDYVGEFRLMPNEYLDANYRFRLDNANFDSNRHELNISAGTEDIRLRTTYAYSKDLTPAGLPTGQQQLALGLRWQVTDDWRVSATHRRDLGTDSGSLNTGLSATFENECFTFTALAERDYTDRGEESTGDSIFFRLGFKHLGEIATPVFSRDIFTENGDDVAP